MLARQGISLSLSCVPAQPKGVRLGTRERGAAVHPDARQRINLLVPRRIADAFPYGGSLPEGEAASDGDSRSQG